MTSWDLSYNNSAYKDKINTNESWRWATEQVKKIKCISEYTNSYLPIFDINIGK